MTCEYSSCSDTNTIQAQLQVLRSTLLAYFNELPHVRPSEGAPNYARQVAYIAVGRDHDAEPRDRAAEVVVVAGHHDDVVLENKNAFYRRLARRRAASTRPGHERGSGMLGVLPSDGQW